MIPVVVRLKYAHSDPLFYYSRLNVISAGNNESIKLILEGRADVGFVPLTHAAHHCDVLRLIPKFAIYSNGPVISARIFRGRGQGYASISDTTVNALAVKKLLGIDFSIVDNVSDALNRYGGVLVIGDDALRLVDRGVPYEVDVGELWSKVVGKPLVYAVMVARIGAGKDVIEHVVNEIDRSLTMFGRDPEEVIAYTSGRLGVSRDLIAEYFERIKYRVDDYVMDAINEELRIFEINNCLKVME